ncbi:hypothetical protein BBC27_03045 [Acidithiobacillus ferrivorans]|uniref:TIGR02646 family protein n=1 Tax=Acidithiobacillus ferrivorans TaxID=160808 RepID=A0A1B9BV99_9PROT|nr:hypothetical protein [Acidithiobacillus ferrivorans]OCB01600.1 hypothetical protein BBC27_03045 [Acidithiobacillus ferrivorans]
MIWIDLEHKLPTDINIPNWMPWTQAQWNAWLATSAQLVADLAALDAAGKREERNALIDANSAHWGALKEWLLALSAGKCWFSEVRELYSHYDVEHFRPKKEAKALDATVRDGYWWLAFDYMNFRVCGNVGNRKKGGWFPLKDGSLCSTHTLPREESETCYLLDPIDDDDVDLIAFDEEGKVIPRPGISAWEQARVNETVKRLKLNEHAPLAEARRKVWQQVDRLIDDFTKTKARCSAGNNPAAKAKLSQVRARVREMTSPAAELSAVARCCLLLRNDPQLLRLVG